MTRPANYCPRCGADLQQRFYGGRDRPICDSCDYVMYFDPKVAVLAIVIQDEKVLLVKRGINPGKGKWACPAGFVEHDEPPEDAVLRELLEETHLVGKVDKLLAVFPKKDHGLADIVIVYQVSILSGDLQAADDATDADWFTRDNLPELVFYPTITMVGDRWRNGRL